MNIYLSVVVWWLAFPVSAVVIAMVLIEAWKVARRGWWAYRTRHLWSDLPLTRASVPLASLFSFIRFTSREV